MTREPVVVVNGLTALVEATVSLAAALRRAPGGGIHAQGNELLGHYSDGLPAIARAYVTSRSHVRSVSSRA